MGRSWHAVAALVFVVSSAAAVITVSGDLGLARASSTVVPQETSTVRKSDGNTYQHVWPPMRFGRRIVLGSLIGLFGAAFGSVGGVGGGGIFVPMLALIIGFDPKSSVAMSKCMIMGAAVSTVYYNLRLKHPTLNMPLIDYRLALLIQPMLMLGISIGVIFNVIFPDWLVTSLLIILFLGTSTKSFLKGIETWKKETKMEAAKRLENTPPEPEHAATVHIGPGDAANSNNPLSHEPISFLNNIYWKEFSLLAFVRIAFLALEIAKNYTATCSALYWVLISLQIPVSVGVYMYQVHELRSGNVLLSNRNEQSCLKPQQLFVYCLLGATAGLVGGLLGVGGAFIMGPLFLELGVDPQVSSATSTFAMMYSSSMSVVEYYLLHRFPVPYAAYGVALAFIGAVTGQNCVMKLINWLGRTSLIIFILASMIFISAVSLGGIGIINIVHKMERHQNMGFESLCKYGA